MEEKKLETRTVTRKEKSEKADKADKPKKEEKSKKKHLVRVSIRNLNIRKGPSFAEETLGFILPGDHEIAKEQDGFGKLAAQEGWIFLSKTDPVEK